MGIAKIEWSVLCAEKGKFSGNLTLYLGLGRGILLISRYRWSEEHLGGEKSMIKNIEE